MWAPPYFRKLDSQVPGEEEEVRYVQDPRRTRSAGQEDSSPQGGHHREQEMIESSVDRIVYFYYEISPSFNAS